MAIARALVNNPELMLPRRGQECPLVLFQGLYAELAHHLPGHFDISHAVGALYSSGKILAAQTGDNQQSAQELAAFVDIHADAVQALFRSHRSEAHRRPWQNKFGSSYFFPWRQHYTARYRQRPAPRTP